MTSLNRAAPKNSNNTGDLRRRLRVLQGVTETRAYQNPYTAQLMRSVSDEIDSSCFTWRRALLSRYDILHIHWPEGLYRGNSLAQGLVKKILLVALLARAMLAGTRIVRTVHNESPHSPDSIIERYFARLVDRLTVSWIVMNESDLDRYRSESKYLVRHGHYVHWFGPPAPETAAVPGRLLFFGEVRPNKNVPELIAAFAELDSPDLSLRVVGHVSDTRLRGALIQAARESNDRASLNLTRLTDMELDGEIAEAEFVVLPYSDQLNSGATLLALSRSRPVIAGDSRANIDLRREVGNQWVSIVPVPLTPDALLQSVVSLRSQKRAGDPDLSTRNWDRIGRELVTVYKKTSGF